MQCWASKKVLPEVKDILGTIHHSYSSLGRRGPKRQRHRYTSPSQGSHGISGDELTVTSSCKAHQEQSAKLLSFAQWLSFSHPFPPAKCHWKGHRPFLHDSVISLKYVFPYSLSLGPHKTQELFPILAQDCSQNGAHACQFCLPLSLAEGGCPL